MIREVKTYYETGSKNCDLESRHFELKIIVNPKIWKPVKLFWFEPQNSDFLNPNYEGTGKSFK